MLTFHRSIFSSGATHSQSLTTKGLREGIAPIVKDLDIDLVLAGHDHSYTRTHLMDGTTPVLPEGDGAGAAAEYAATPDANPDDGHDIVHPKDGQVIYITANSSSGSKYYELVPDGLVPWKHTNSQNYTPQFTNVDVKECSITSTTMTHTGDQVDKVELVKDKSAPTITHPGDTTVRLGADFDPMAGVEVSDACSDVTVSDITVTGEVDTSTPGDYELSYTVTDSSGNEAKATRTITVAAGDDPTEKPTDDPTGEPTDDPTDPSDDPSEPSEDPTDPSDDPTDSVRELTVTPETITAADFVKDGAVEIVARGCTSGSTATVTVEPEGSGVTAFTDTATADETGAAAFAIYGENAETPEAYVGSYDVTVRCEGGDDLTGRFTVVAADDGDDDGSDDDGRDDNGKDDDGQGGGDRDGDGERDDRDRDSDGRELPRTGSDIGWALAAGGGLVALGAGVFALARRRTSLS
ncbi:immunoglobulin-like domain-containing protein [Brevibacterium sp. UBA7493]|uniref:immunoglobulin-like domain-containing protein n=1 Tax=Brevibacterium sp. UBA7493 TaxID=1946121 RepID=UPI0025806E5A|nr:immunoglobulin-like domain-containing protein [Brevibacterium sp. UBA7493]